MPTASDLVTDLPADFEVFGQAVDTSLADLKGGTTDQVLAKNSNTDMDFKWVTSDDANAIQNSIVDAKGDLIAASANDTPARLAVGTNGHVLTADSTTATGLKWAAVAAGGKILQVVQGTTTTSTTIASTSYTDTTLTATITPSAATSKILCLVSQNFQNQRVGGAADGGSSIKLVRGATDIVTRGAQEVDLLYNISATSSTNTNFAMVTNIMYVDSPSTTSATTYKTQGSVRFTANSNQVTYQTSSSQSQIILLEIGA